MQNKNELQNIELFKSIKLELFNSIKLKLKLAYFIDYEFLFSPFYSDISKYSLIIFIIIDVELCGFIASSDTHG